MEGFTPSRENVEQLGLMAKQVSGHQGRSITNAMEWHWLFKLKTCSAGEATQRSSSFRSTLIPSNESRSTGSVALSRSRLSRSRSDIKPETEKYDSESNLCKNVTSSWGQWD